MHKKTRVPKYFTLKVFILSICIGGVSCLSDHRSLPEYTYHAAIIRPSKIDGRQNSRIEMTCQPPEFLVENLETIMLTNKWALVRPKNVCKYVGVPRYYAQLRLEAI